MYLNKSESWGTNGLGCPGLADDAIVGWIGITGEGWTGAGGGGAWTIGACTGSTKSGSIIIGSGVGDKTICAVDGLTACWAGVVSSTGVVTRTLDGGGVVIGLDKNGTWCNTKSEMYNKCNISNEYDLSV